MQKVLRVDLSTTYKIDNQIDYYTFHSQANNNKSETTYFNVLRLSSISKNELNIHKIKNLDTCFVERSKKFLIIS